MLNNNEPGYISELTSKVKKGDTEARKKLIENNFDLIKRLATETYNSIKKNYQRECKYSLSNNIITLDDVIQDFYIRALNAIDNYIDNNCSFYFSVYLNNMLVAYKKHYSKSTLDKLLKSANTYKYELEDYLTDKNQNMMDLSIDKEEKEEILQVKDYDICLKKYSELIDIIFKYSNYQDVLEQSGLSRRKLTRDINQFGELYQIRRNQVLNNCYVEDIISRISDIEDPLFMELYNFYRVMIVEYINIIINQVNKIDSTFFNVITIDKVEKQIIPFFYNCVECYKSRKYVRIKKFDEYLSLRLRQYSKGYVAKFRHMLDCKKTSIQHLKRKKMI